VKTVVRPPEGWRLVDDRDDGGARWQRDDGSVVLEVTPLELRGEDDAAWRRRAVVEGADPADVRVGRTSVERAASGWPMEVIEVAVVEGERLLEARLVVLFVFLQHRTALRFRAREPAALTAHHPEVMAILGSAGPDWSSDELLALSELWS
jgi:hypothetical protein